MKNFINYLSKKSLSLGNGSGLTRKWFGNDSGMTRFSLVSLICVLMLTLGVGNVWGVVIYSETFGDNGNNNTAYASATCYSATTSMFTSGHQTTVADNYSGSGKVGKNNVDACGLPSSSGLSAAWHQASSGTSTTVEFQVDNIDISGYTSLSLAFNLLYKNGKDGSKQNNITVSYKIDGGAATALSFTNPTGTTWTACSGSISGTGSSLTIIFTHSTNGGYTARIDDIVLTGTAAASGWKLKGSFDSWGAGYDMSGSGTVSVTRSLAANTRYEFKIYDGSTAYGNNGAIVGPMSGWTMETDKGNCRIHTANAGNYTFELNTSTKALTVTYPDVTHPSEYYVYFKNSDVWGTVYGFMTGGSGDFAGWPGTVTNTTTICGETYHYAALLDNGSVYNKIIFNNGESGYGNQTSDLTMPGAGKYNANRDANWHDLVYTISYAEGDGGSGSMDPHSVCPGDPQALSSNDFSKSNYHFTGWVANVDVTINSATVTQGTLITGTPTIQNVQSNIILTAQWDPDEYTIIYKDKDNADFSGVHGDGYPTTHTYGTATALVSPTKVGYDFGGWYTASNCESGLVTSLGATAFTSNITLYAKWTAKTLNITWSANGTDWSGGTHGNPSTSVTYGGKIATFPTSPAAGQCDGSKEFVGWTLTPIVGTTNTKPTFVSPQTTITETGNFTLYAVFATRTANSYSLGDINDLINGKNVIVYNANQNKAMASSIQATGKLNALAVTFSSTNISSPDAALIWTVTNSGTKYIFQNSSNNYLRVTASGSNTKLTCDNTSDTWTITEVSTGVYSLYSTAGTSSRPLEAYYSNPNYFFTSYSGSGANWNMKFYVPTYSAYQTACSSDPVLNVSPTSLDFGNVANGTYKEMTFSLTGSYLTANASIGVSGTNSSYFSVTPSSVSKGSGTIAATDITVRYTPGAVADGHTATVTVSSTGATPKTVTLTGNCKASYTVTCSAASNGSVSADKTSNVMAGETVTLTITPSSGYQLSSISAVDGSSNPVSLTGTGNSRTFTMPASNVTVTATFVVRTDYVLVTNVSELNDGDVITIANMKGNNAEGKILHSQADNNRNTKAVTTAADGKIADSDVEYPITLVSDASGWKLYDQENAGYLYAVKGSNYLKNSATPTPTYNDVWTIEIVQTAGDYQYQARIHQTACNGGGCGQESRSGNNYDRYIEFNSAILSTYLYNYTDGYIYKKELGCDKLAAPTGLTASSITQTTVTLSWNSVSNASGYEISLNNGSSWTSTSTNTSYNATGLTAGTTYNWKVRATGTGDYCAAGNAASSTVTMKNAVKVTYKTNGATGGQLPVAGGVVNLTEGDSHTILGNTGSGGSPTPLTKTGYVFDGWHSSSTYSSTPAYTIGSSITVNSNVDIYANWKPKKDTFVDAVHNTATQYGEGANYTIPSCDNQTRYTSGTCEETHYKFIGWALAGADLTNPSNIIHAGDTQTASGTDANPKTYYAVWAEEL